MPDLTRREIIDQKILWDTQEERALEERLAKYDSIYDRLKEMTPAECYEMVRNEYASAKNELLDADETHDLESVFHAYAKLESYNLPDALRAVESIRIIRQACRDRIYETPQRTLR